MGKTHRLRAMSLSHAETQAVVLATIEALEAVVELATRSFMPADRREAVVAEVAGAAYRWHARIQDELSTPRPAQPIEVQDATKPKRRRATQTMAGAPGPTPGKKNGVNGSHNGGE